MDFIVTFSESVTGVDIGDFALTATGNITSPTITTISGSGDRYVATVNTGDGDNGTLRLDVMDDDSILGAKFPLGGIGTTNGNFTDGKTYTIDRTAPYVLSSMTTMRLPNNSNAVEFTVVFSEHVSGVDIDDFFLTTTGDVAGVYVTDVNTISSDTYTVVVNIGSGNGSIRLDIADDDTISDIDSKPLGGIGVGNGSFLSGQVYFTFGMTRVSLATNGMEGIGASNFPAISADGRFITFVSSANNLVNDDLNDKGDIFVRDTSMDFTTLISVSNDGIQANGHSYTPSISGDGRYIAFESAASNLVAGDANGKNDIFVRDTTANITVRVSVATDGTEGNNASTDPAISVDGRFVAFRSSASNLVGNDTNSRSDIFVRDMIANTTIRVSVAVDGTQGNGDSYTPTISADGRFIGFMSYASNLVSGDTSAPDIFVRDTTDNTITLASVTNDGTPGYGSFAPSISADGQYVVFASDASNLVNEDTNGRTDIFVRDMTNNMTTRVSVATGGTQGYGGDSLSPSISANGRYVAFESLAYNLISADTNSQNDIFIHDVVANTTSLVSIASDGEQGFGGSSGYPSITPDGRSIVFYSHSNTLVVGDTNGVSDIFVYSNFTNRSSPRVINILRTIPISTDSASVEFSVIFSQPGLESITENYFTLTTTGVSGASITGVSGSGITYRVTVNTGSGDGTIRLDTTDGLFTNGETYTINKDVPIVLSVSCVAENPSNASTVDFTVTFSKSVTGVDAGDFALTTTGITDAFITGVSGSGDTYTVTVNTGSGDGTIRLDLIPNGTILDNLLTPLNAGYTSGQVSTIDKTAPAVLSSARVSASPTRNATVNFRVTFSEPVIGVDGSDFQLATTGGISGATIGNVTGSNNIYTVTVNTGSGNGTIRLDVVNTGTITDTVSNPLNGGFTGGESYTIDKTAPTVLSSVRVSTSPTTNPIVDFTVTFSESVTGVDVADFSLTTTGTISGATVTSVTPVSASVYTVRVDTGTGSGTIRLNVLANGSIKDIALNPFAVNFLIGQDYTIVVTLTIQSVGTYDGWILEGTRNVAPTSNATAVVFNLGDGADNNQYRAFLHFNTASLPDTAVITEVALKIKTQGLVGTDPFTILGGLRVDIRKPYFGSTVGLVEAEDFQAAADMNNIGSIPNTPVSGWYTKIWTTDTFFSLINRTGSTQFRLRFSTDTNNNDIADYIKFYSGDHSNPAVWPTLIIEYYVP